MYIITNGVIVTEKEMLRDHAVIIEKDRIKEIILQKDIPKITQQATVIDAEDGYISPGFIDIHSDYIEQIISPRPTAIMDFRMGIQESERILVTHGITTMFHSLSLYKDDGLRRKPIRRPENVYRLIDLINETHQAKHIIRNRVHARFEIDNIAQVDNLTKIIEEGKVHLLSFMDHTPGQGQYRDLVIYKETLEDYEDLQAGEVEVMIEEHQLRKKLSVEKIREISAFAKLQRIAVASHDDDKIDKLALVKSFGTTISEFPITLEVAKAASSLGLWTLAGAPNVLMGGSHSGNLSAVEALAEGCIDILCSDYYPLSLLHSLFELEASGTMGLHQAFQLVTLNPARAVNMQDQVGSIEAGKKADIIVIEKKEKQPSITICMVDGKVVYRTNYR